MRKTSAWTPFSCTAFQGESDSATREPIKSQKRKRISKNAQNMAPTEKSSPPIIRPRAWSDPRSGRWPDPACPPEGCRRRRRPRATGSGRPGLIHFRVGIFIFGCHFSKRIANRRSVYAHVSALWLSESDSPRKSVH